MCVGIQLNVEHLSDVSNEHSLLKLGLNLQSVNLQHTSGKSL